MGSENGGDGLGKHGLKAVVDEGRGRALESVATHGLRFGGSENGVVRLVVWEVERVAGKNIGTGKRVGEGIGGCELGLEEMEGKWGEYVRRRVEKRARWVGDWNRSSKRMLHLST